MNSKTRIAFYSITLLISAAIFCMCTNLTGSLLSYIMVDYHMNLDHAGWMTFFLNMGGVAGVLGMAVFADRFHKPILLVIAYALLGAALFMVSEFLPFALFMGAYFLLGSGLAMIDVLSNAVLSDLHPENRDMTLCQLHAACGFGASFMPIVTVLVGTSQWTLTYRLVAIVVFALVLLQCLTYKNGRTQIDEYIPVIKSSTEKEARKVFFSDKNVWIATISMLAFCAFQGGTMTWCVSYCKETYPEMSALAWAFSLSAYWIGTTITRLTMGVIPSFGRWNSRLIIIWGSLLGGAFEFIGLISGSYFGYVAGLLLLGASTGVVMPRIVGMMTGWYPTMTGLASSLSFLAVYVAFSSVPLLMGIVGEAAGMQIMMYIPVICAALCGIVGSMLPRNRGTRTLSH